MTSQGDAARADSDAIGAWCAAHPAPAWPVLPEGVHPADFTEIWSGVLEHDPARGETTTHFSVPTGPVQITYTPASYRVWPHAFHYSRQLGTLYHWYWTCLQCGYTTKDLIPTREMAVSEAEGHVAGCADDED